MIDLTVSCTGQRQIKKEGLRTGQKKFGNNKTVEITVGEGGRAGGEQYSFLALLKSAPARLE